MSDAQSEYSALSPETLVSRLGNLEQIRNRVGAPESWKVSEVGDGNLNLVFIVKGETGTVVVKQALPYVRLVGDSWPLPLKRAFFEYHALTRQAQHAPGTVPEIYLFDETQALIIMEFIEPHIILRLSMMGQNYHENLAQNLGEFCARTLFRSSDLSLETAVRKADVALFADNVELCDITENLIFTDPYFDAEMNRHTAPYLDTVVASLRNDFALKAEVQHLKWKFCSSAEALLHGDLHSGSVMVSGGSARVIDPEFAFYGPMGFDIGLLLANFLTAYYSQLGYGSENEQRKEYQDWILDVTRDVWRHFEIEFSNLWRAERKGIAYPSSVFEDQGHKLASELALTKRLSMIFEDTLGFCGTELHRRILGLAHNAEFEEISDEPLRARCEARALELGRQLILNRSNISGIASVLDLAREISKEDFV